MTQSDQIASHRGVRGGRSPGGRERPGAGGAAEVAGPGGKRARPGASLVDDYCASTNSVGDGRGSLSAVDKLCALSAHDRQQATGNRHATGNPLVPSGLHSTAQHSTAQQRAAERQLPGRSRSLPPT